MRETEIIEQIRKLARAGPRHSEILLGIGDDAAILRPSAEEDLVFTSDFVLEGRHFTQETHTAAALGHKALARSLSDLAAMGAEPVFCLVSLAIPPQLGAGWVRNFYKGLLALATKYHATLAGGDLASFDKITADVVCCGRVPRGKAILRSGAKPGDAIYVTGALGAAAHALRSKFRSAKSARSLIRPEPRIREGIALRRLGVRAGMDLSDGLALDLHRLCVESKVSADLNSDLPIAPGATVDEALQGGDDYELLFTASHETWVPSKIDDLPITRIGTIRRGRKAQIRFGGRPLTAKGFDHFAERSS